MPLYEYRCQVCGESEEKIQSYAAPTQHDCPGCGAKEGMTRQISAAAFSLSGGGWYAQGYGDKAPAEAAPKVASGTPKEAASGGCCGGGCSCATGT